MWLAQCIRIWRKSSTRRGPSILHRTRRNRQILRGNSVDASNPLRASLQVHLCLRHAKPVDAMVSVQILFHALSCHKYPASLRSSPPSFIRFTVGCTSRTDNSHIALIRCHKSLDLPKRSRAHRALPMTLDGRMAFESPPPPQTNKATQSSWRGREAQSPPDNTPARQIAEAWIMETKESQDKWKEADAKLRDKFDRRSRQIPPGRKAKM